VRTTRDMEQNRYLRRVGMLLLAAALVAGSVGCVPDRDPDPTPPPYNPEIRDWYDLDAIRYHLDQSYTLMNDLDSTTPGYAELAGPAANDGKGWEPIGFWEFLDINPFTGTFDGQGYEIRDLFINRPEENNVGLFGFVAREEAMVENVGVVSADVTGDGFVGGLVGRSRGDVSNSYVTGTVTGDIWVGGLVGSSERYVSNSYSNGTVTGQRYVGGLAGEHMGDVINSYATGTVTGQDHVGGLVGSSRGDVRNSYFSGSVTGDNSFGGLIGIGRHVSNSHYNYDEVLINGQNTITVGALFAEDFDEWLANDMFLDVDQRLVEEDGCYLITDVDDFKQLLAFGQDDSLKFRLQNDLDLADDPNFFIPYLAGEFDGNGHTITNLSFGFDSVSQVGLFGYLHSGGSVSDLGVENVNVTGGSYVGGLVGRSAGDVSNSVSSGTVTGTDSVGGLVGSSLRAISNSYSTGTVTGEERVGGLVGTNLRGDVRNSYATGTVTGQDHVGGLVGSSRGDVSNSYFSGSVTGENNVGGLVGDNRWGDVINSHYNYDEVLINGQNIITIGALFGEDFDEWLANDMFLDVNDRLVEEDGYRLIRNVDDFKQLLAFGRDDSLKFRLQNDLDLADDPNFFIPYLAGDFDGNGRAITNLSFGFDSVSQVGLFGYLRSGGNVTQLGVEGVDITGGSHVGGLVGYSSGDVSNSYSSGTVTGENNVGGLVGYSSGDVNSSYSSGTVTGEERVGGLVGDSSGDVSKSHSSGTVTGENNVGGLVGYSSGDVSNSHSSGTVTGEERVGGLVGYSSGDVSNSHSSGTVTGEERVGGLVGYNLRGDVRNSFWDVETSGMDVSDGGTGKTTAEMMNIATFTGVGWSITAVDPGETDDSYIWNIVDGQTYPFLSWEPVS